ncbi:RDD family protein [Promicromonospora sp. Populi]|uniref:RDD family protein n=1 Tax=Promicromonospora sp. Populi TaxID=3239420 RepID=UPI0034E29473
MLSSENARPDGATGSPAGVIPEPALTQLAADAGPEYATWGQRVVAAVLDNAILAGVTWLVLGSGTILPTLTLGLGGTGGTGVFVRAGDGSPALEPLDLVPIGVLVIFLLLQALTGWTPGKLVTGIRVVRDGSDGQTGPAGPWRTLARWVLHLLDAILLIGYLRPAWHAKRQTFADSIVQTVVVQEAPELPRRPRIVLYSAALVVCVLGLGYGCVPISGGSSMSASGDALCELNGLGPLLTTGQIAPGGSLSVEQDRRMWTVRETRTVQPGATISWTSDPSVRDVDYRVELDARPGSEDGTPLVSRSWDIGSGSLESWSDNEGFTHARTIAADGDTHEVEVNVTGPDDALATLGNDLWIDVRLIADGDVVAACGGTMTYGDVEPVNS